MKKIPLFLPFMSKEAVKNASAVLQTPWIGEGPKVKEFEKKLVPWVGSNNVLTVNNATSAIHIALRLANVRGGEVISTPMTCTATNEPIINEGGHIVWADINPNSGSIDPADIEKKITKKTKAIMIVHWGGNPCDLTKINSIGKKYGIKIIEDAAQALGSTYKSKPIGSYSDYVFFSFQAIKIINTVDGGALITRNKSDWWKGKELRWYGIDRDKRKVQDTYWDYPIKVAGYKFHMNDVTAAIGLGQLPYLDGLLKQRREQAAIYRNAINESKTLKTVEVLSEAKPNWWMFTVLCGSKESRLKLWKKLSENGIDSGEAHIRNDLYPVFKNSKRDKLDGVTKFNNEKLCIPIGYWVTKSDVRKISDILASF
ncbi:MAG: DegT/DnrJ/EryC1/StrS family aminotransferase [Candidatus Roizmanbacteria bacterium]|nr:DegT/DnrJ/EryC1/StrS family aminotransferase [Candidatus Roizmanbacteria bacterium]